MSTLDKTWDFLKNIWDGVQDKILLNDDHFVFIYQKSFNFRWVYGTTLLDTPELILEEDQENKVLAWRPCKETLKFVNIRLHKQMN
eukprot:03227.XXX_3621_3878_1 [CDS] Oithona nana genome sequencing.